MFILEDEILEKKVFDIFFSYNSKDRLYVERIGKELIENNVKVFIDKWYLTPGLDWANTLEQHLTTCKAIAIFIGPHGFGDWQQREKWIALERQTRDSNFKVIPIILPGGTPSLGFLAQNMWIDLREQDSDFRKLIEAAITSPLLDKDIRLLQSQEICPYLGLNSFQEEDEGFFFGRESFVKQLISKLSINNFIAVVGASGSGKSSIVKAGLLPHLRSRQKNNESWEIVSLIPGKSPLKSLANSFIDKLYYDNNNRKWIIERNEYFQGLLSGSISIEDICEKVLMDQPGTNKFLIFVDQWEEIYTQIRDKNEAERFIDYLIQASENKNIHVVITLRGDFFGKALAYRPLADKLNNSLINLGPMTNDELRRAIAEPAKKIGLVYEDKLIDRILADIGDEPGKLPLVQFAITELWRLRENNVITHVSYGAMGENNNLTEKGLGNGVRGALARKAEAEFKSLDLVQQSTIKEFFIQNLVVAGDNVGDTRRRAKISDIDENTQQLLESWVNSRLLVASFDDDAKTIEIAHEALIQNWDRLGEWLNEDREFLLWLQRIRVSHREWSSNQKDDGYLLQGAYLIEAASKLEAYSNKIPQQIVEFIKINIKEDNEKQNIELSRIRELAESRRKTVIRTRYFSSVLTVLLLLSVSIAYVALSQRNKIKKTQDFALISSLGALGEQEKEQDLNLNELVSLVNEDVSGDPVAQYTKAILHGKGLGLDHDKSKAKEILNSLVDSKDHDILYKIAKKYEQGWSGVISIDEPKAISLYTKAINLGSVKALLRLSSLYNKGGVNTQRDEKRSFELLEIAASKGNAQALNEIGNTYRKGGVVERNLEEAMSYYEAAIDKGSIDSLVSLGEIYEKGDANVLKDLKRAEEMYKKAANFGKPTSLRVLGERYASIDDPDKDIDRAESIFKLLADLGDTRPIIGLAKQYQNSNNMDKAHDLYKTAMELGSTDSFYHLAHFYDKNPSFGISTSGILDLYKKYTERTASTIGELAIRVRSGHEEDSSQSMYESKNEPSDLFYQAPEAKNEAYTLSIVNSILKYGVYDNDGQSLLYSAQVLQEPKSEIFYENLSSFLNKNRPDIVHSDKESLSLELYQRASNLGMAAAASYLGEYYYESDNLIESKKYFKFLFESGEFWRLTKIADKYSKDATDSERIKKAIYLYEFASDTRSNVILGKLYLNNSIYDFNKAREHFERAYKIQKEKNLANHYDFASIFSNLADNYAYKNEYKGINNTLLIELYKKSNSIKKSPSVLKKIGDIYANSLKDYEKAESYYRRAAELGDPQGLLNFSSNRSSYMTKEKSIKIYLDLETEELNLTTAVYSFLAKSFLKGDRVKRDIDRSFTYYLKAIMKSSKSNDQGTWFHNYETNKIYDDLLEAFNEKIISKAQFINILQQAFKYDAHAGIELGSLYMSENKYKTAEEIYNQILEKKIFSQTLTDLIKATIDIEFFADAKSAQQLYIKIFTKYNNSKFENIFLTVGESNLKKNPKMAMILLHRAAQAEPIVDSFVDQVLQIGGMKGYLGKSTKAFNILGKHYEDKGLKYYDAAWEYYTLGSRNGGDFSELQSTYNGLARISSIKGDQSRAEIYYEETDKYGNSEPLINLAMSYHFSGNSSDIEKAINLYKRIQTDTGRANIYLMLCYFTKKDMENYRKHYNILSSESPWSIGYNLTQAAKNPKLPLEYQEKLANFILDNFNKKTDYIYYLNEKSIIDLLDKNDLIRSLYSYVDKLESDSNLIPAFTLDSITETLNDDSFTERVIEFYKSKLPEYIKSKNSYGFYQIASVLYSNGKYQKALDTLEKISEMPKPYSLTEAGLLSKIYLKLGYDDKALSVLTLNNMHYKEAELLISLDKPKQAELSLLKLKSDNINYKKGVVLLANYYFENKDWHSFSRVSKLVKSKIEDRNFLLQRSLVNFWGWGEEKNAKNAHKYFKQLIKKGDSWRLSKYADTLRTSKSATLLQKKESLEIYRFAADYGDIRSQLIMGKLSETGYLDLPPNIVDAVKYYTLAANKNNVMGLIRLYDVYLNNRLERRTHLKASDFLERAMNISDSSYRVAFSLLVLSKEYKLGDGKNVDLKKSDIFFNEANKISLKKNELMIFSNYYKTGTGGLEKDLARSLYFSEKSSQL